ncbi:MAG: NAD-binding protein [Chloroflexi bacterium]|nr:NAD-binding protein [Chloroflexota bacterium]
MYIIVVGGGRVGRGLALELQGQPDHEVVLIERGAERAAELRTELGEMVVRGDGTEVALLDGVGASRCDLLIALTDNDAHNLVACQVATHHFHVPRTIARVDDPENERLFRLLGVGETISAARAVMAQIEATLPEHTLVPLLPLHGSGLQLVELHVQPGSPASGGAIRDLALPQPSLISLVIGPGGEPRIPGGDTVLQADDEVIAVTPEDAEPQLRALFATPAGEPEEEA